MLWVGSTDVFVPKTQLRHKLMQCRVSTGPTDGSSWCGCLKKRSEANNMFHSLRTTFGPFPDSAAQTYFRPKNVVAPQTNAMSSVSRLHGRIFLARLPEKMLGGLLCFKFYVYEVSHPWLKYLNIAVVLWSLLLFSSSSLLSLSCCCNYY